MMLTIWVPGKVAPGGSKSTFIHPHTGRIIVMDACKDNASWKQTVKTHARLKYPGLKPYKGAIAVDCIIYIERPKSHFCTGKNAHILKASAPKYPVFKPDTTKLWRSTEDALTGIAWVDVDIFILFMVL